MNKKIADAIRKHAEKLGSLQDELNIIKDEIDLILSDEQERYDNMSERSQEGDKGVLLAAVIDNLENASGEADSASDSAGAAKDYLINIIE